MHSTILSLICLFSLLLGPSVMAQRITPEQVQVAAAGAAVFGVLGWHFLRQGHIDIDIGIENAATQVDTGVAGSGSVFSPLVSLTAPSSSAWATMTDMTATTAPVPPAPTGSDSSFPPATRVLSAMLLSTIGTGLIGSPPSETPLTTFYWATHDDNYRIIDVQEVVGWRVGNFRGDKPSSSYSTAVVGDANRSANEGTNESNASSSSATANTSSAINTTTTSLLHTISALPTGVLTLMASKWQELVASYHLGDNTSEQIGRWLFTLARTQLVKSIGFVVHCVLYLTDIMGLFAFLVVALVGRYSWFLCKELPSLFRQYGPVLAYLMQTLIQGMLARCAEWTHDLTVAWGEAQRRSNLRRLKLENAMREAQLRARSLEELISGNEQEDARRRQLVSYLDLETTGQKEFNNRGKSGWMPFPKVQRPMASVDQGTQTDDLPAPAPVAVPAPAPAPTIAPTTAKARVLYPRHYAAGRVRRPLSTLPKEAPFFSTGIFPTGQQPQSLLRPSVTSPQPRPQATKKSLDEVDYESSDEEELARLRERTGFYASREPLSTINQRRARQQEAERLGQMPPSSGIVANVVEVPASESLVAAAEQTQPSMQEAETATEQLSPVAAEAVVVVEEALAAPEAMPLEGAQSLGPPAPMAGAWVAEEEVPEKVSSEAGSVASLAEKSEVSAVSEIPAGEEDFRPEPTTSSPQSQQDKPADEEKQDGDDDDKAGKDNEEDEGDDSDDNDDDTKPDSEGLSSAVSPAANAEPLSNAALPTNVNLLGESQEVPRVARQSPRGILRTENGTRQSSARVRFAEEIDTCHFRGDSSPMEVRDPMDVVASTPTAMPVPAQPEPEAPQVPQLPEVVEGEGEQAQVYQAPTPAQPTIVRPTEIESAVRTRQRGSMVAGRRRLQPVRRLPRLAAAGQFQTGSVFAHLFPSPSAAPQPEPEPVQQSSQQPHGLFPGLVNQGSADAEGSTAPEVDMEEGVFETPAVQDSFHLPSTMDVDRDEEPPRESQPMEVDAVEQTAETSADYADGEMQDAPAPVQLPPGAYVGEDGVIELGTYTGLGERDPAVLAYRQRNDSESDSCSDSSDDSAAFEALMGNLDVDEEGHYRSSPESQSEGEDSDSESGESGAYSADGDAVDGPESDESDRDSEDSDLYGPAPESRLSEQDWALMRRYWPDRAARLERQMEGEYSSEEEDSDEEEEEDSEEDGEEDGEDSEEDSDGWESQGGNSGGYGGGDDDNGDAVQESKSSQETESRREEGSQTGQPLPRQEVPPSWRQVMDAIADLPEESLVEPSSAETMVVNGHVCFSPAWVATNPGFLLSTAGQTFLQCNERFRREYGWKLIMACEALRRGGSHQGGKRPRWE